MNSRPLILLIFACAVIVTACRQDASSKRVVVYCAANLKKPVEAIAEQYRKEFGVEVSLQYGPTGTLLTQLQVAKQGDLFIAADDGALEDAKKKNLIKEVLPLVVQHPVIAVKKGNPHAVHALSDLLKPEIKLAVPNPDSASIGKITRKLLAAQWEPLAAKAVVMKPTVTEIAADVQLGSADAAFVWDSTVPQFKELEAIEAPELTKHRERASAAVLTVCTQSQEALRFARYMAAPDKGGVEFQKQGFTPSGGDKWAVKPEMILYSGGVNRLAIEKLLHLFADREGIDITTVFNGCGILCATMKTMGDSSNPKFPDAYYACDVCFVPPVAEHFPESVMLTETDIVIAVPKGNPHGVKTLADLAQPGLRVGLCNAEQSTLGFMTRAMLKNMNIWHSIEKNVAVQVPTADFLINQMRAGGLDAAIVYKVNVLPQSEHLESIALPADKGKAVQPFAVRENSERKELGRRLLAFLKDHKESFEQAGFSWRGDEAPVASDKLVIPAWLKQKDSK
jgi:molybdate transport system substrate-binding protein